MDERARQGQGLIAALGAMVAGLVFASTVYHSDSVLREPDLWWHIKTGLGTLASGAVPQTDMFSYTHAGQPWIAKEWLSQVIYALAYLAAGWAGPLIVAALAMALTCYLVFRRASRELQPIFAAVLALMCAFVTQGIIVARPHVLTFPIAVTMTVLAFDGARAGKAPPWWSLGLIILWTNLHGSFAIAFLASGCAFIDYVGRHGLGDRAEIVRWLAYIGLSAVVTLVNPYFYHPYVVALALAGGIDVMARITEWAPFSAPSNPIMEFTLFLTLALLLKARAKFTFGQILFLLVSLHMMLTHVRFLYVFFVLVPLALVTDVVEAQPGVSLQSWLARKRDGVELALAAHSGLVRLAAVALVLAYSGWLVTGTHVVPPETSSISHAIAFVEQNREHDPALNKQVFNDYNFGGPLILAGFKTYIDGRADQLFLGEFMRQYLASGDKAGVDALKAIVDNRDIGWVIFPPADPRLKMLATLPGWQKTYGDAVAEVWERKD